jgi:hypothetical protein
MGWRRKINKLFCVHLKVVVKSSLVKFMFENLRCELVSGEDVSHLEGKIKTMLESAGMKETQEKAMKDIAGTILWDWFNFITNHRTDHLMDKKRWYQKENAEVKSN